jgi:prenyltransferase beta subunit
MQSKITTTTTKKFFKSIINLKKKKPKSYKQKKKHSKFNFVFSILKKNYKPNQIKSNKKIK